MRNVVETLLLVALAGTAWAPARGDDAGTAQALVQDAVRAHGGAEALAKTQLMVRKNTGSMSPAGKDLPFTDEMTLQLPERWRWSLELGDPGQKFKMLLILNGDKGWQSAGGMVMSIPQERIDELREEAYVLWLATLLPLTRDNSLELSVLPEAKVNDQPALGLKVASKGHASVNLYFDKRTSLLVKIERRAKQAGLVVDKEYLYSDHKAVDGVQLPTKYIERTDGKKFVDVTNVTYQFPKQVDDSTFAKP